MRGDGRVDADQLSLGVYQSTTTITRIDGSISLDEGFHRGAFAQDAEIARLGAHDARCDGGSEVEGITHSQYPFADANIVGIAKGKVLQI